ncbi:MAG: hypothetical protein ACLQPN_15895 [Bryobacteraceae bacterium]
MKSQENFKKSFLADLANPGVSEERFFKHGQIADQYGVTEARVWELLIAWAAEGLIAVRCGAQSRDLDQWETARAMFFNRTDAGDIRVRLLSAGAALAHG